VQRKIGLLFAVIVLLNLYFNGRFQLHYDEAYYWVWSKNLNLSYFDHPPMIAYLIYLTNFLGHGEFYVRLSAVITTTITLLTIFKLSQRMFGPMVANIALLLAISCPLFEGAMFVVTIDSPLFMFWALTLYCFYRGIFEHSNKNIYLAGIFSGCALLSKYTAVLIFPSLFIFLLCSTQYRNFLWRKEVYIAFILAMIIFSPVIIWNYQHNWASFNFQFNHGVAIDNVINWHSFGDFWGGTAIVMGPFIFLAILYYTVLYIKQNINEAKLAFLFWSFSFGFIFFAYFSLYKHNEANWSGPLFISGIILLAKYLVENNNKWVYKSSFVLIVIILALAKFPLAFVPQKFHNRIPAFNAFFNNKELIEQVKPLLNSGDVIIACDYGNASRIWFYLQPDRVYVIKNALFANSYNYWPQIKYPVKHAIYVCDNQDIGAEKLLHQDFKNVKLFKVLKQSNIISDNYEYIYDASN
jgi:4-amino-4-deoxy-L-arabinose transferase-like glycosyltransferase